MAVAAGRGTFIVTTGEVTTVRAFERSIPSEVPYVKFTEFSHAKYPNFAHLVHACIERASSDVNMFLFVSRIIYKSHFVDKRTEHCGDPETLLRYYAKNCLSEVPDMSWKNVSLVFFEALFDSFKSSAHQAFPDFEAYSQMRTEGYLLETDVSIASGLQPKMHCKTAFINNLRVNCPTVNELLEKLIQNITKFHPKSMKSIISTFENEYRATLLWRHRNNSTDALKQFIANNGVSKIYVRKSDREEMLKALFAATRSQFESEADFLQSVSKQHYHLLGPVALEDHTRALPNDVMRHLIVNNMPCDDAIALALTCKMWKNVILDSERASCYWFNRYRANYPRHLPNKGLHSATWYRLVQYQEHKAVEEGTLSIKDFFVHILRQEDVKPNFPHVICYQQKLTDKGIEKRWTNLKMNHNQMLQRARATAVRPTTRSVSKIGHKVF